MTCFSQDNCRSLESPSRQIQASDIIDNIPSDVIVQDIKLRWLIIHLGLSVDDSGGSDTDIELAHSFIKALDYTVWRSSMSLLTKFRLYNVFLPCCYMVQTNGIRQKR